MQFVTRPLEHWPRPLTENRRRSPYSTPYDKVLRHLEAEIRRVDGGGDVVIQIDVQDREISAKGAPFTWAKPASPRVAIAFKCRHGNLTYYCDRFTDWQGNVRAIGLGLERLRLVEDTGITHGGEQYTGFRALPPGIPMPAAAMTVEDAAAFIAKVIDGNAGRIMLSAEVMTDAYRIAAGKLHPDRGGDRQEWDRLQEAREVLVAHHKGVRR